MSANSLPRLVRAIACLLIAGAVPVIGSAQPPGPKPDAPAEPPTPGSTRFVFQ